MVQVVDQTDYQPYDYRENNEQLAKENGELRQRLGNAIAERNHQLNELHRKNLEIINLKSRLNELANIKIKYDKIALVVMEETGDQQADDQDSTKTIRPSETIRAIEPPTTDSNISSSSTCSADSSVGEAINQEPCDPLDRISEASEQNSSRSLSTLDRTPRQRKDSLEPSCATSVPNIFDRTPGTPSIWNCLSSLKSPCHGTTNDQTLQPPEDEICRDFAPQPPSINNQSNNPTTDEISSLNNQSIIDNPDNNNSIITNISNIEPNVKNTSVECSPFSPNNDLSFKKTNSKKKQQQQVLFSSTPVQIKGVSKKIVEPQATKTMKLANKNKNLAKDNQENVLESEKQKEEPKTRGRKRGANKALSSDPQPPTKRYNLRNRAK